MATTWRTLRIGAGGQLTSIDIVPDGTRVVRTDTYGAYWFNPSAANPGNTGGTGSWQQIVSKNSMPAADAGFNLNAGVYEIVIAPSNSLHFYMYFNGYIYSSVDRGTTWIRSGFSNVAADPNTSVKFFGPFMAVDPINESVLFSGTITGGAFYSNNGGTSFSAVATVAAGSSSGLPQGGGNLFAFDPTSAVSAGKTQGVYATAYGTGVYHSTDGGTSWALLNSAGMPTTISRMIVDKFGIVWITDNSATAGQGALHKYASGAWSAPSAGTTAHSIAVDPASASAGTSIVVVGNGGGQLNISRDGGATWTGSGTVARAATDIPWLAWTNENFMTNGNMVFDSSQSNVMYFAEGIGAWTGSPPGSGANITWTSQSSAIEQLVSNWMISPPNGNPLALFWDRPIFVVSNPNVYPLTHGPNNTNAIIAGWSADWASVTPSTVVAVMNFGGGDVSGKSIDGGVTWSQFATIPAGIPGTFIGGCIAASTATNFVWVLANDGGPFYTKDGGSTWTAISIAGAPIGGWDHAYFYTRQIVCADRVTPNTFYMYNDGTGNISGGGIYQSTDSGDSWIQVNSTVLAGSTFNTQMRSVPGQAGDFFITAGQQSGTHPNSQAFYRSVDGGANLTVVSDVTDVWSVGFGKAATGQSYPTIFIYGAVNNVMGIWQSDDGAVSWTKIGDQFPLGSFDQITYVEGDNNTYGTVYIGFKGSGAVFGQVAPNAAGFFVKTSGASSPRVLLFVRP